MKMQKTVILFLAVLILSSLGCSMLKGASKDMKDGYKFEEAWSIGFLVPSYQYKKVSKCQEKEIEHEGAVGIPAWTETVTVEPCVPLDGYGVDTASPFGPAVLDAASTVATGALIADGLKGSGDSNSIDNSNDISNSNAQGQGQTQGQGQLQGQIQLQGQGQRQSAHPKCKRNCGRGNGGSKFD